MLQLQYAQLYYFILSLFMLLFALVSTCLQQILKATLILVFSAFPILGLVLANYQIHQEVLRIFCAFSLLGL